jgi:hypothetical protein
MVQPRKASALRNVKQAAHADCVQELIEAQVRKCKKYSE